MLKNTNTPSLSPGCLMFHKYTAHVKFMLTGLVWDAVHWGRAKDVSAEREMRSQLGRRGKIPDTNMERQKDLGLLINAVSSHQVNSGTKWRVWLALPRPTQAYKHTQAFRFILCQFSRSSHAYYQFKQIPLHLRHEANTYELTQSTTIFFHRFLVPTILTMHVFLGFFWRALWSSANRQTSYDHILDDIL